MPENIEFYDNEQPSASRQPANRPPADPVRVTDYRVMPWPDGTRVTVEMGLTPFKQFPAMDVSIVAKSGQVVRTTSMVGAIERRPAPTLHLPPSERGEQFAILIEMLDGEEVMQTVIVPFEVGGPIIKDVVSDATQGN